MSSASPWASPISFCPKCLLRVSFRPADREYTWVHCSKRWEAVRDLNCPHSICGRSFEFTGQGKCPFCQAGFDDGVPLSPRLPGASLLDRVLPSRGLASRTRHERVEREIKSLRESWRQDSTSGPQIPSDDGTRFTADLRKVLSRHEHLLNLFQGDVEKFLYSAPVRLAKLEAEYSWKFEDALAREVNSVLDGILYGRHSVSNSLGFVARCSDEFPNSYSRRYLVGELRRKFFERRSAPRPGFQLTLEYARTLDGIAFEEWLTRLLRDAGVPGVCKTQASRDQGADLVITIGSRVIAIQAKNYQDTVGNSSVQEAFASMHFYNANEAWVVTTSTFSRDAIDLAFRTGVRLIDGSRLLNLPEIICGPSLAASNQPALSGTQHSGVNPEATLPVPTVLPLATTDVNQTITTKIEEPLQSPLKKLPLRSWQFIFLGIVAMILIVALLTYRSHISQQKLRSEQGIQGLLESYQEAERSRNPQLLAECYAPEVSTFYLRHNVSRNDVQSEFQRALSRFDDVHLFAISEIVFSDLSETRGTATFDKEWDFRGTKSYAGKEQEQMIFHCCPVND